MFPACPYLSRFPALTAAVLLLAGCNAPTGTGPDIPPQPSDSPPAAATAPPAGPTTTTEPATPPPPESVASPAVVPVHPAAAPVVAQLAKQLRLPETALAVAQVTRADWPNACLGLAAEGEICADVITPGFAVSVIVDGQRYEFRTDESGRRIRLAFAPLEETGEALLTWKDSASFSVLQVGTDRVAFGLRGRPLLVAPAPLPARAQELVTFLSRYAPFYARTSAGEIILRGVGSAQAAAVERRQLAEWARQVFTETNQGREQPFRDRAFVWRREGGAGGFCDELVISRTGLATAWSCRDGQAKPVASARLNRSELEQLYRWLDTLGPHDWSSADGGADSQELTTSLTVEGQGTREPSDADRDGMLALAHALVRRILTERSSDPP